MNGAQHFAEAERLIDPDNLRRMTDNISTYERQTEAIQIAVAQAQVHATLSVAYGVNTAAER